MHASLSIYHSELQVLTLLFKSPLHKTIYMFKLKLSCHSKLILLSTYNEVLQIFSQTPESRCLILVRTTLC